MTTATLTVGHYMTREKLPERRKILRQKVVIHHPETGAHTFYVEFGEFEDGRLGEVFITAHKTGTFVRGTLDALARSISLALQSGTSPRELAKTLCGMDYPPSGLVSAPFSRVDGKTCSSIADYIGQEIMACYGEDGKRLPVIKQLVVELPPAPSPPKKVAGRITPGSGV